jgi:hypothetical protein
VIKSLQARNAACNAVVGLVNTGSALASGRLNICSADSSLLVSLPLSLPAYRDATDGTCVANPISDSTVLRDGTAALYYVWNRDQTTVWTGSVVPTGHIGDLRLNSISLEQDSTVVITNAFFSVPA